MSMACVLVCSLAAIVSSAGCLSASRRPHPGPSAVIGQWVGAASFLNFFIRLDLHPDGKGSCATVTGYTGTTRLYRVDEWTINAGWLDIRATPIVPEDPPLHLRGQNGPSSVIELQTIPDGLEYVLVNETIALVLLRASREAMGVPPAIGVAPADVLLPLDKGMLQKLEERWGRPLVPQSSLSGQTKGIE